MKIQTIHYHELTADQVRISRPASDGEYQVYLGVDAGAPHVLYLTAAEMSDLGHRLIELSAQAAERESGAIDAPAVA